MHHPAMLMLDVAQATMDLKQTRLAVKQTDLAVKQTSLAANEADLAHQRHYEEQEWRDLNKTWRRADLDQRTLDNARRMMDEKLEQLRSISSLAALIAGFDIVVLVELQIPDGVPDMLITLLVGTTSLTVCLMCLSFVTCTLMLVGVLKAHDLTNLALPFEEFWRTRCAEDWERALAFFTWGVPMFMLNLIFAGSVKFYNHTAPIVAIAVVFGLGILAWWSVHNRWGKYLQGKDGDAAPKRASLHYRTSTSPLRNFGARRRATQSPSPRDQTTSNNGDNVVDLERGDGTRDVEEEEETRWSRDPSPTAMGDGSYSTAAIISGYRQSHLPPLGTPSSASSSQQSSTSIRSYM